MSDNNSATVGILDIDQTVLCVLELPDTVDRNQRVKSVCGKYFVDISPVQVVEDKLYRDKAWLTEQYVTEGKTMQELGNMFSVSPMTIYSWLTKFDIPTRSRGRRQA